MTTRHDAIKRALATATEAMHDKGEVQPMIIAHTDQALMAFPLGGMMDSATTKDAAVKLISAKMRKSVMPAFMSS
jgi:hypothetical protein